MDRRVNVSPPRGTETILLVAAEPETRKLAAFMLAKQGYRVLEARDRAEALGIFETYEDQIDLVLADVCRFRHNAAAGLAESLSVGKPCPRILYISDPDHQESLRDSIPERQPAFLPKPFTMQVLAGRVREALDAPRARGAGLG
jgi:two-component system cell cycle sensor histidine kinase/response regulator CckA